MSGLALKLIAVTTMLIDHIGHSFHASMPQEVYLTCRIIGRLAFPIFCFLLAEGLFYTKNPRKYLLRMCIFAVISEMPFDLFVSGRLFDMSYQNVFVTLALSLSALYLFDKFIATNDKAMALAVILAAAVGAVLLKSDYGAFGVLFCFVFYLFRDKRLMRGLMFTGAVILFFASEVFESGGVPSAFEMITLFEVAALLPILLYNGKKGFSSKALQWGFYAFYPAHLLILYLIRQAVTVYGV